MKVLKSAREKEVGRDVATTIHSLQGRLATSLPISGHNTFMLCCEMHFMGVSHKMFSKGAVQLISSLLVKNSGWLTLAFFLLLFNPITYSQGRGRIKKSEYKNRMVLGKGAPEVLYRQGEYANKSDRKIRIIYDDDC